MKQQQLVSLALIGIAVTTVTTAVLSSHEGARADPTPKGEVLVRKSDCLSCHAIDHKVVGPAFISVAKRYAGQPSAVSKLVAKVRSGGSGNWGSVAMTPHPDLSTADLTTMVKWVLSLHAKSTSASMAPKGTKTYTYMMNGRKIRLDFPVFARDRVVTHPIFNGWQLFDAYCFRCHGPDAVGGELAPDLRTSLQQGMTKNEFISTALAGRPGKGMPSWAGFFSSEQIENIYRYVKARSVGLVEPGRPAGE